MSNTNLLVHCSFCEESQSEAAAMVEGPGENICDKCILVCNDLLKDNNFKPDGTANCSFCSKAKRVINKDGINSDGCICEECIELCNEIMEERRWKKEGFAFCSFFCRKTAEQVPYIVMGPKENICSDCVRMCSSLLESKKTKGEPFRDGRCFLCGDTGKDAELVGICDLICSKCLSTCKQQIEANS